MAYQFKDNQKTVHIDIAGNIFDIPYTTKLLRNMKTVGEDVNSYISSQAFNEDSPEDMALFVYDRIDLMLGESAADKIFDGREPDYLEAVDVLRYIIQEVDSVGRNRKERRATAKTKPNQSRRYNGKYK